MFYVVSKKQLVYAYRGFRYRNRHKLMGLYGVLYVAEFIFTHPF